MGIRLGMQERGIGVVGYLGQTDPESFHSVTIAAGHCVRRPIQESADFFKRVPMPDLQHDDFALIGGKLLQARDGCRLGVGIVTADVKPRLGFPFAGQSAPETASMIDRTISDRAHQIVLGALWLTVECQEGDKNLLDDVLSFPVSEPQGTTIQDQFARLRRIEQGAPVFP